MIDFTCKSDDGDEYTVTATARDVLVWEKTGKDRNFAKLMSELPLADLYVIAHIASRRQGKYEGPREQFEKTIDLMFDGADEPDPFPKAP